MMSCSNAHSCVSLPVDANHRDRLERELAAKRDAAPLANAITSLSRGDLARLILELTEYASFLISTRARWIPRGVLPQGYDAPGLAMEALARVLDGRRRPWDPRKETTLTRYLKSVVKSIFSETLKAAERERVELAAVDSGGRDFVADAATRDAGPDLMLERAELQEAILREFNDDEDQLVLLCLFDDVVKPAEIAEDTGLSVAEVYRIKRKIKRRLSNLKERV